jgi:hypothetical protein
MREKTQINKIRYVKGMSPQTPMKLILWKPIFK